jgi:hypothetical protein
VNEALYSPFRATTILVSHDPPVLSAFLLHVDLPHNRAQHAG